MRPKTSSSGFTLIELLIVVAIIAILAGIALPVFSSVQERARITQDLNNLRQLGIAAQTYLNDHDGVLFSSDQAANPWMQSLHPKYLPNWKIFQSPFDNRSPLEDDANAPISYGLNGNPAAVAGGSSIGGLSMDKVTKSSAFIVFAPAQNSNASVKFQGTAAAAVKVYKNQSTPGGNAKGGTHSHRGRVNALFADLHSDDIAWDTFKRDASGTTSDKDADFRWDPSGP